MKKHKKKTEVPAEELPDETKEPVEGTEETEEPKDETTEVVVVKESKLKKVLDAVKKNAPVICAAAGAITAVVIQTVIQAALSASHDDEDVIETDGCEVPEEEEVDYGNNYGDEEVIEATEEVTA